MRSHHPKDKFGVQVKTVAAVCFHLYLLPYLQRMDGENLFWKSQVWRHGQKDIGLWGYEANGVARCRLWYKRSSCGTQAPFPKCFRKIEARP